MNLEEYFKETDSYINKTKIEKQKEIKIKEISINNKFKQGKVVKIIDWYLEHYIEELGGYNGVLNKSIEDLNEYI